jgi:hypothetical protein
MNESWIKKAIEKQQRDVKDIPRYLLDAYAGNSSQQPSTKRKEKNS